MKILVTGASGYIGGRLVRVLLERGHQVEEVEGPRRLLLRAEMKVPGRAWLEWESRPERGGTRLIQTAIFEPFGLAGALYWYALYPVHRLIFSDLARAVAKGAGVTGTVRVTAAPAARGGP